MLPTDELTDEQDRGVRPIGFREPPWFANCNKTPCECDVPAKIVDFTLGPSDSKFIKVQCTYCKHTWAYHEEG